jgi:RNA polymerase sigma factor (sigma-70 family)
MEEVDRRVLFVIHREALLRFVRRLVSSDEDAEEMVQELALIVLTHRAGPDDANDFAGWCRGVARNVAAHRRRTLARRRAREDNAGFAEPDAFAMATQDDLERVAMARQQLAGRLNGLDLAALNLLRDRFVLEETPTEMAARLNVSAASIRMRVARLVAALRKNDADDPEEGPLVRIRKRLGN